MILPLPKCNKQQKGVRSRHALAVNQSTTFETDSIMIDPPTSPSPPPVFQKAPPLDSAWLAHEHEARLLLPKPPMDPLARQPLYADECRRRNAAMMAAGARDHRLSQGITTEYVQYMHGGSAAAAAAAATSLLPVLLQYDREADAGTWQPEWVVIYFHGGALLVGEADSEDLSCRRIVKDTERSLPRLRLYSVGYRLKPQFPASVCLSDSLAAFHFVVDANPGAKILIVGSSSGAQLAALVTQQVPKESFHGVVLRCPVTSDAFRGKDFVPERFRHAHTSAWHDSFQTSLFTRLDMDGPRDGLERLPLEAQEQDLKAMPRTWLQMCTNDALYSDGACYSVLLQEAGIEVETDVVFGWPHTFWLKAPQLPRALEADEAMIRGLKWVAGLIE